jgi:hypothetical protein
MDKLHNNELVGAGYGLLKADCSSSARPTIHPYATNLANRCRTRVLHGRTHAVDYRLKPVDAFPEVVVNWPHGAGGSICLLFF